MRGGRAVSFPGAQAFGHASKETRAAAAETVPYTRHGTILQAHADPKGIADPKNIASSKIFPHAEADAGPET